MTVVVGVLVGGVIIYVLGTTAGTATGIGSAGLTIAAGISFV